MCEIREDKMAILFFSSCLETNAQKIMKIYLVNRNSTAKSDKVMKIMPNFMEHFLKNQHVGTFPTANIPYAIKYPSQFCITMLNSETRDEMSNFAIESPDVWKSIGWFFQIKASEGGGGKGIRKCKNEADFRENFQQVLTGIILTNLLFECLLFITIRKVYNLKRFVKFGFFFKKNSDFRSPRLPDLPHEVRRKCSPHRSPTHRW